MSRLAKSDRNILVWLVLTIIIFTVSVGASMGVIILVKGWYFLATGVGLVGLALVGGLLVLAAWVAYQIMS